MKPLLDIQNLSISFGSKPTIKNLSFSINTGETLGLVGESGSGKSLTASAIMQLLPEQAVITSGQILFNDQNLLQQSHKQMETIRGKQIGQVLQDPMTSLNPVLTIGEQLTESLGHHFPLSKKEARDHAINLLIQMGIRDAEMRLDQYPHELSGGQRQRVLIAIALCCKPKMLIADEPTTALDANIQAQLLHLLRERQKQEKMTLLFISHDLHALAQICERVIVMKNGELVEQGPVAEILQRPQHPYTQILVQSKRSLTLKETDDLKENKKPILSIRNLHKSFKKSSQTIHAVIDTSLTIEEGKTLGLAGESGCGKSTLGKCLARLIDIDQGSIQFCGQELTSLSHAKMIPFRKEMQIIFQNPFASLNPRFTILEILTEPMLIHRLCNRSTALKKAKELMTSVGLSTDFLQRYPDQLSGGQRQRVAIARALSVQPKFIICDEILSSLDATTQMEILQLLIALQNAHGISYLFISHDLPLMGHLADHIAVMYEGRIVEEGLAEQVLLHPTHPFTKKLIYSSQ